MYNEVVFVVRETEMYAIIHLYVLLLQKFFQNTAKAPYVFQVSSLV